VKPSKGKMFYKVDYRYSYINLLFQILDITICEDPYLYLGKELGIKELSRDEIKATVFKILFSNEIKQHLNINALNKIYYFSVFLEE
jgi:hypothetical protein